MANEKRLIDANALQFKPEPVDNIMNGVLFLRGRCVGKTVAMVSAALKCMIDNAPTVDAVEVVHGRWTAINQHKDVEGWIECDYVCSACGEIAMEEHNYCPNCGAKMRGDTE